MRVKRENRRLENISGRLLGAKQNGDAARIEVFCTNSKIEPGSAKTSPDSYPNGAPSLRALEGV
jgi:hypothetical protein